MDVSCLRFIVCGMFVLMALGFVFVLVLALYDTITEAKREKKEGQHGNR